MLMTGLSKRSFHIMIEMTGAYTYKQNAQEIFENFFGTNNPFAAFGFDTMPFASKLNKPGPAKAKPVTFDLECTLKGELFLYIVLPVISKIVHRQNFTMVVSRNSTLQGNVTTNTTSFWTTQRILLFTSSLDGKKVQRSPLLMKVMKDPMLSQRI